MYYLNYEQHYTFTIRISGAKMQMEIDYKAFLESNNCFVL
jgi:hypothetical protein